MLDHLTQSANTPSRGANKFTKIVKGENLIFVANDSLFAGPSGKFAHFVSTRAVSADGTLRLTTMIPKL